MPQAKQLDQPKATEVLPCPFCGGQPEVIESKPIDPKDPSRWTVYCVNKSCGCRVYSHYDLSRDESFRRWNTRADVPVAIRTLSPPPVLGQPTGAGKLF